MATNHSPPRSPPNTPPTIIEIPPYASIPYSSSFSDDLMSRVLDTSAQSPFRTDKPRTGIHILPSHISATPAASPSLPASRAVPLSLIQETSIPVIETEHLPLELDDPRRIYNSTIPGVLLTHPGGFYEGGPCTDSTMRPQASIAPLSPSQTRPSSSSQAPPTTYATFVTNFLARYPNLSSASELQRVIREEQETQLEILRARMREREDAKARNAEVERKLEDLVAEREVERRVEERWNRGER